MSLLLTNAKKHIISRPACTDHLQFYHLQARLYYTMIICSINSYYHH